VEIAIRPLEEASLDAADRVFRLSFGTFVGLPDPLAFAGDTDYVRTRWRADPTAAHAAELDGKLVGFVIAARWGSVGFFGPLSVHPDLWDRGIAKRLLPPVMECFARWGTTFAGLFTFAQSAKHVALYQRFGFWPRFLTAVMERPVAPKAARSHPGGPAWTRLSRVPGSERDALLAACRETTGAIYPGLDVTGEIRAVETLDLGDTIVLTNGSRVDALAVCHRGAGTEAGSGTLYVKFGVVRSCGEPEKTFDRLLDACDELAADLRLSRLLIGMNTARNEGYRHLVARGFRTDIQGVAMQRGNEPGYNREGVWLIDDWR
jgi:GNAT superfamily N-acetyltransferase